jgi:hypothetical protein
MKEIDFKIEKPYSKASNKPPDYVGFSQVNQQAFSTQDHFKTNSCLRYKSIFNLNLGQESTGLTQQMEDKCILDLPEKDNKEESFFKISERQLDSVLMSQASQQSGANTSSNRSRLTVPAKKTQNQKEKEEKMKKFKESFYK